MSKQSPGLPDSAFLFSLNTAESFFKETVPELKVELGVVQSITDLSPLDTQPNLDTLFIKACRKIGCTNFTKNPNIRTLNISQDEIRCQLADLSFLMALPNLEIVFIWVTSIENDDYSVQKTCPV